MLRIALSLLLLAHSLCWSTAFRRPLCTSVFRTHNRIGPSQRVSFQCSPSTLRAIGTQPGDHQFEISTRNRPDTMESLDSLVSSKGSNIFDNNQEHISVESLEVWEKNMESLAAELKDLNDQPSILRAYASILKVVATKELTPLQVTAFHVLANVVSDSLMKLHPVNAPITSLIDDLTDVHLKFIDVLLGKGTAADDNADAEESLADSQEYLSYQYAGLTQYMYHRISNLLGGAFDTSSSTQEMRRNMWLAPVLSRLQRRCVRFSSSAADERIEDLFAATFAKMLDKIKFEVLPRYSLAPVEHSVKTHPVRSGEETGQSKTLPAWELAHFVQKVLRNSVQVTDLTSLESKVCGVLRERLSTRIRALHRPMERIIEENRSFLSAKETKTVEDLLNVGHECLAAVWVLWQIRHNIVGVPNAERILVKDFLRPVSLHSVLDGAPVKASVVLESIPKDLRPNALEAVHSLQTRLQPSVLLESVALLADAVRQTAGEEFRALSTYNMDSDELPFSRDAIYITALSVLLSSALTAPTFEEESLCENLLAFVVLEETLGVREPRAACAQAYEVALKTGVMALMERAGFAEDQDVHRDLQQRVQEIEKALGMMLRLPDGEGAECRLKAFQSSIDEIVAAGERRGRGLRDVQSVYPWVASILGLSPSTAENYVKPLGQVRFDKTVGEMLLNSDVAISMPELGATFEAQVHSMAEALLISPQDAEDRTVILAGAVLSALLENALDQSRKMSAARVDSLLQKAHYMYKHPLLRRLQDKRGGDIKEVGMQMAIARVGRGSVVDLMRVLEAARSRMAAIALGKDGAAGYNDNSAGWGTSAGASSVSVTEAAELGAFIQSIQAYLLKEFTTGNFKKGFAK